MYSSSTMNCLLMCVYATKGAISLSEGERERRGWDMEAQKHKLVLF